MGQKGAEETESTAFWLLDLYGQATCKNAASLVAYRFSVMLLRAGAHGVGASIAGESDRQAWHEAAGVIRTDLPKAATGLLMGALKKSFPDPKNMGPVETFAEQLIGLQIFVFFEMIDFELFDLNSLPPDKRQHPDAAFIERMADKLPEEIIKAISEILVSNKLKHLPPDSPIRKHVERLGAVIPAVITSSLREIKLMKSRADAEHRAFRDLFASEGGWALVRIIRDAAKALMAAPIKSRMEELHAADLQYYRALILSIRLDLAPVDFSRVQGPADRPAYVTKLGQSKNGSEGAEPRLEVAWNQKSPRPKPGPDKNGDIGIAKLKPVAGEAAPTLAAKPPKPTRAVRNSVRKLRDKSFTPTPEQMVATVLPAYSSLEQMDVDPRIKEKQAHGEISDKPHTLAVMVRDPQGKTIKEWWEISELKVALGTSTYLGHTEQKALARIQLMDLKPGATIIFVGYLQPCNREAGCSTVMNDFVRRTGIPIDYRHAYGEDGDTLHEFNTEAGRITQRQREEWRRNQ